MNLKELTKQASGAFAFFAGIGVLASIGPKSDSGPTTYPRWLINAAKISLICSALSSPWSVFLGGWLFPQAADVFGPNTAFVINPWHPKHVLSLVGAGFGTVVLIGGLWTIAARWRSDEKRRSEEGTWIVSAAALHTIVSRPALHIGNWLLWRATGLRWL